jgi:hypothetical protein
MLDHYRSEVVRLANGMRDMYGELFNLTLALAFQGDLKEVEEAFEVGDVFSFKLEHLEGSDDSNQELAVRLLKTIAHTADYLIEKNDITQEELDANKSEIDDPDGLLFDGSE